MLRSARSAVTITVSFRGIAPFLTAAIVAGGAAAQSNPFTVREGWPQTFNGSTVDGGVAVNLDDDPELEIVYCIGSGQGGGQARAFNLDGTTVPGWPRPFQYGSAAAPAVGDLDGDGSPEVVFASFYFGLYGLVYAWHADGTSVSGYPINVGGTIKGPTLADLDGDGDDDVVIAVDDGFDILTWAWNETGDPLPGWPVIHGDDIIGAGVAVGDLDGDDDPEVVVGGYASILAYHHDGTPLDGFPWAIPGDFRINYSTPGLADFDGDGDREIVFGGSSESGNPVGSRVWMLHHTGLVEPGWPRSVPWGIWNPVSIADIDRDGELDIAVGDNALSPTLVNRIHAWDRHGTPLPGFPSSLVGSVSAQAMVADLDGDGEVEIVFDDNLAVCDLPGIGHDGGPQLGWPFPLQGASAFRMQPIFGDFDLDGFIDMAVPGNEIAAGRTRLFVTTSTVSWNPDLALVATYQYDARRSGVADAVDPRPPIPCPADLDGDGVVNGQDIGLLFVAWGPCGKGGCDADLSGDGVVNGQDLGVLFSGWGDCP